MDRWQGERFEEYIIRPIAGAVTGRGPSYFNNFYSRSDPLVHVNNINGNQTYRLKPTHLYIRPIYNGTNSRNRTN